MAFTRSHLTKQRAGTHVTPTKVIPHDLLKVVLDRPGAAICKQLRVSQRIRTPSAQLREELEKSICRTASAKAREEQASPRFLFVPFPDIVDIAEETHIAIDASNVSDRFLARYPMYNAQNMAMIQRELGKGFASFGMTSVKPYYQIPILHQGIVTMQHLSHTFKRDVTFKSWEWLQAQLKMVNSRPKCHNTPTRKTTSHPRKTQQQAFLTDPSTSCIIYLHWTIDPGPPTADLTAIHSTISTLQALHPHKLIRAFPSLSETTSEILKIPDIRALDAIAATSPFKYAYRPLTCFTHASPTHNMRTCPLRGHKRIIMKRTHSCSGTHVELISGDSALPRHYSPAFNTTTNTNNATKTKQQPPPPPSPPAPIYFAQSYEPCFSLHGEYRIFIASRPSASPTAIRGREGRVIHTVITEWVDKQDPGAMYARVASAQDFHPYSQTHSNSDSRSRSRSRSKSKSESRSRSRSLSRPQCSQGEEREGAEEEEKEEKASPSTPPPSLPTLHAYALYIYNRLRFLQEWRSQFESLEMGVRLDIGVGTSRSGKGGSSSREEGQGRFFVNEITRFYGADYFSQHTLGAPQQEVCWAFVESVDGYFFGGGAGGRG